MMSEQARQRFASLRSSRLSWEKSMRLFTAVATAGVLTFFISSRGFGQSAPSQPSEALPQLQHIDTMMVDTSISPCDNFYQYACEKMNAANPIPPDQVFWGVGGMLQAWNRQVLRQILDRNETANAARTPSEQKIGDLYATCMVQASAKTNDLAVIQPLLAQIAGMRSKREIAAAVAAIDGSFGRVWQGNDNQTASPLFGFGQQPDYNDVSHVVGSIDQGGLGMPSRDYYLKSDPETKTIRDKYVALMVALLKMDGTSAAVAASDVAALLRLETAMASAQMDNISRRDPAKVNNRYTLAQLKTLTPEFDWDLYFKGIDAPAVTLYEVSAPDYFHTLDKLLAGESLETWKLYLRCQLLLKAAPELGNGWRDALFAFNQALTGQTQQPPDWRRCTIAVDSYLGEALGQVYVAQVFPRRARSGRRRW